MTRNEMVQHIDRVADHLRTMLIGDPIRIVEYKETEEQARAFAAALYLGTPPTAVQAWMDARNWTARVATDDIIQAADVYWNKMFFIRAERLKGKYAVLNAADDTAAMQVYQEALTSLKSVI